MSVPKNDLSAAIAAAREALARLREHDGGTRYNGSDDDAGERACCVVASWKPHDSDCPHAVAVAEFDRLLAALDAAQPVGSVQTITSLVGETRKVIVGVTEEIDALPAGAAVYLAPQAPPAAVAADTHGDEFGRGWNACRAAMLAANKENNND